mgnify:CR=1 FL=1
MLLADYLRAKNTQFTELMITNSSCKTKFEIFKKQKAYCDPTIYRHQFPSFSSKWSHSSSSSSSSIDNFDTNQN